VRERERERERESVEENIEISGQIIVEFEIDGGKQI